MPFDDNFDEGGYLGSLPGHMKSYEKFFEWYEYEKLIDTFPDDVKIVNQCCLWGLRTS